MKNYKYDFRHMDKLTDSKDLQKSIKINTIILVVFFILFVAGFICGVIFIPQEYLPIFIAIFSIIGIMEAVIYTLCIKAIMQAFKKIQNNKSEIQN